MLEACDLTLAYGEQILVKNCWAQFHSGQCWAILGPNGAGKSTLLKTLAGLHSPDAGKIMLNASNLQALPSIERAKRIGWIGQAAEHALDASVWETVAQGRYPHQGWWGLETAADASSIELALSLMDVIHLKHKLLSDLSGGEQQRVYLARLFAQDTDVLLLDEPNNHLDIAHQMALLQRLQRMSQDSLVIMALHDVNLAARFCSHVILMKGEGSLEMGTATSCLTAAGLSALYDYPMQALETEQGLRFFAG